MEENDFIAEGINTDMVKKDTNKDAKSKKKINIGIFIYNIFKRIMDIIGSIIGIVILIPTTICVYIARKILREDDGPLFYEQLRYTKHGKQFRLYKYRSMCMNAGRKLDEYLSNNEEARKEFEENHKLKHDPRITRLGDFLRKTSLDELPQMINIFKGDMSFVGPRPVIEGELEQYGDNMEKFLSVKPGLTGYWQANGRSNTSYEERMKLEMYYIDHYSFWLDVKIFFKTFIVVLKREGAM